MTIGHIVRSAVALLSAVLVATNGSVVLILIASSPSHPRSFPNAARVSQSADLLDRSGKIVLHVEGGNPTDRTILFIRALRNDATIRTQLRDAALAFGKRSNTEPRPSSMVQLLDALAAPTTSQFHALVRRLPVSVARSPLPDDLAGVETRFFVRGVERLRLKTFRNSEPAAQPVPTPPSPLESSTSEEGESGASAVPDVTDDECLVDDQPVACATEQEREDALIAALAMDDEASSIDAQVNSEMSEYYAYCDQNPWDCSDPSSDPEANMSGPSDYAPPAMEGCSNQMWSFVAASASTHGAAIGLIGLLLAPAAVPALVVVGGVLAIGGGLAWMYSAGSDVIDCKRAKVR